MPITTELPITRLSRDEFGRIAHEVTGASFEIHNEMGRLLSEVNYRNELMRRFGGRASTEVKIELSFEDYSTVRYMDFLIDSGAIFELKAVDRLSGVHRAQLLSYLLMTEVEHGELINFFPRSVEHEFVNASISLKDRKAFCIRDGDWLGSAVLRRFTEALLRDWGTGLSSRLYEEALVDHLGGVERVEQKIPILSKGQTIGSQKVRLAESDSILKITTLERALPSYKIHCQRLLKHTEMTKVDWINIGIHTVTFTSLTRQH